MFRIFAILQIFAVLFSTTGINVFAHTCSHTGTVDYSIIHNIDKCEGHACCDNELANVHENTCCEETHIAQGVVSNCPVNLNSTECCKNLQDYLVLSTNITLEKTNKLITFPIFYTLDFIPKIDDFLLDELPNNIQNSPEIRQKQLSLLIDYIQNSGFRRQANR